MDEAPPSQVFGPGQPYLERWWLEKSRAGCVYLHRMSHPDPDQEFHDHPADNLSIVLDGEMIEQTEAGVRVWQAGDMIARRAPERHRIQVTTPIITMWIMGPKVREWGFWRRTSDGSGVFVHNQQFFKERGYF